jgi:hypothetical protein
VRLVCQAEFILKVFSKIAYFKENFMKNKKFLAALLLAAVAFLFSACTQSNGGGTTFEMNAAQKAVYDACIANLKLAAELGEIDADQVQTLFSTHQSNAALLNFQIVDTKKGTPIPDHATEEYLRARFVPKKK